MVLGLVALVVVGTAVGFAPRNPEWFAWDQLPAQAALVQSFGVYGGLGWNAPSWSISALLGCYLAFPWILMALKRAGPWTALIAAAGLYLLANALTHSLLGYPVYQMPMMYGVWRALPLFLLGMALAVVSERVFVAPRLARVIGVAAVVGLATVQAFDKHALISIVFISLILLAAGAIPVTRPSKWVEKASVVSFAMFITNEPVRIAWFGVVNVLIARFALPVGMQWGLWALGVLAAFVFAFVFHALIDQPIQNRIKGWLSRRRTARRPVEAGPVVSIEG
jgi:peptidoglycan/LPS O-acetylase OafA/YrhL